MHEAGLAAHGGHRILLHACCGPCSLMPIEKLREEGFSVTLFFYNPNIHPQEEYDLRREALSQAAFKLGVPVLWEDRAAPVQVEEKAAAPWCDGQKVDPDAWVARLNGRTDEGIRCAFCYRDRLVPTARLAADLGFDGFTSSLLYSRYQHHESIAREAESAARSAETRFLYRDFRPWWQDGIDLSKSLGLYRQKWCGCLLSRGEAERQRAESKARRKAVRAEKRVAQTS